MGAIPDVFVIGGGPVGLAAAIAARRKGLSVILADSRHPPIDKACGEGMLPDGLPAVRALGLELPPGESFPIRGIRFLDENVSVSADFPQGHGFGVCRTALHKALVECAERAGVELRWGVPVTSPDPAAARWIIGADGASSRTRILAGLDKTHRYTPRYGFRQHFEVEPWSDFIEIYWGPGCQIYVTPVGRARVGIALISRDPKLRVGEALRLFPQLRPRLRNAPVSSREMGAVTATRRLYRVVSGNIALIGDASGSVDAITGEGLSLGFHHALALADALKHGDLSLYQTAHLSLARRPRFMSRVLLALDHWPAIRKRAFSILDAHPRLFAELLAIHVKAPRTAVPVSPEIAQHL